MTCERISDLPVLVAPGLFLAACLAFIPFTTDDAFISFRYAENLLAGHGLVYNPGERVEGFSNLLWVLLIAALWGPGIDPVAASKVLGILSGLLAVVLAIDTLKRIGTSRPGIILAALMLSLDTGLVYYSVSGLETSLFVLELTAVLNFLIVSLAVFVLVKQMNRLFKEKPAPPAAPTTKECPFCHTEIPIAATRCPHCTSQL